MSHVRTLVVVRHAKAEAGSSTDFERRLTEGGLADARAAGAWLAGRGVVPDLALVSAAARTTETWVALRDAAAWEVAATETDYLYDADLDTVLDLVHRVTDAVDTLVVVGHNPAMGSLAQLLDDGDGDGDAVTEMTLGFPTSAVGLFGYDGSWGALGPADARVLGFHVGRA